MKVTSPENKRRIRIVLIAGIVFVLASTLALLSAFTMVGLAGIRTSAENNIQYGYDKYYIYGEEVSPSDFYSRLSEYYYSLDEINLEGDSNIPGVLASENPETGEYDITLSNENNEYQVDEIAEGFTLKHFDVDMSLDENLFGDYMGKLWMVGIVSGLLIVVSLILVIVFSGIKNEDGSIALSGFDKAFTEIHVVILALMGAGSILVYVLMDSWQIGSNLVRGFISKLFNDSPDVWNVLSWYSVEEYHGAYLANIFRPPWVLLILAVVGSVTIFTVVLLISISLVKKIKSHTLLRTTILGRIIYGAAGAIGESANLALKVYGGLGVFSLVIFASGLIAASAFASGEVLQAAISCLIGAAVFIIGLKIASKQISNFRMIKQGAEEVQKGNFSYKIPPMDEGEFSRLADSINSITDAQNEAMRNELKSERLRSELISNVSHDLRTPLTSMVSYVDLLKSEGLESPNAEEYLNIIGEKTERLHKLTEDLFEAAKASSGDIPVNVEKIDLDAMARQAIAEMEENLASSNVEVVYTCKTEDPHVMADGNLLWRVLENLMTNVSKYALPGTRAYVDVIDKGDKVALEVKNMSRDSLNISADELLERFKRGDYSRNTEGSGLGLAIANDLTALMNGKFEIYIDGDLFKSTVELFRA